MVDQVWYLPVKTHHFGKDMSPLVDRLAMLQLILPNDPRVRIELYETQQEGVNYTYLTLVALSEQHPDDEFYFVIGSDNLQGFHRWLEKHPGLLRFPFLVYPRAGFPFSPLYENMTPLTGMKTVEVSSTEIRNRVSQDQSITSLVLPEVERYIENHHTYEHSHS